MYYNKLSISRCCKPRRGQHDIAQLLRGRANGLAAHHLARASKLGVLLSPADAGRGNSGPSQSLKKKTSRKSRTASRVSEVVPEEVVGCTRD